LFEFVGREKPMCVSLGGILFEVPGGFSLQDYCAQIFCFVRISRRNFFDTGDFR
jgi:hypothetical protein